MIYTTYMTFAEKRLYHQIHPLKLTADISATIISLFFFWQHYLLIGLIIHFLLPVLGSFFVIKFVPLEKQKKSAFGKYIKKYMTGQVEAVRLAGDVVTIFGAWYQQWLVIFAGIVIIFGAWFYGKIKR